MRVLCFGRFYDEIPGGMQRHIEHLFAALRGRVDFVHLVPSRNRHASRMTLHGFPVVRTASLNVDGSLALSPGLPFEAMRLHRASPFDLIHLHFPDPMSHLASLALPATIPRIISWHADILRHRMLLKAYGGLLRRAVGSASAITVATPSHLASSPVLARLGTDSRVHVIPYGYDFRRLQTPHPLGSRLRAEHVGKTLLTVGRHVGYKGTDVLIRAMVSIEPSTRLLIVGTGPLTQEWERLAASLGLADRIRFAGLVPDSDLPAYYQACDVFCLPSVTAAEAFGIVQIEAMACAKPIVSTRLGTGVDFVNIDGATGYTVTPGNVDELAGALNRVLDDDHLRDEMGQAAHRRAESEFSLSVMADRTFALYREAIDRAQSSRVHPDPDQLDRIQPDRKPPDSTRP